MSGFGCEPSVRRPTNAVRSFAIVAGVALALAAGPAAAQDLTFHFVDPSFGGNPFYSTHLLDIATIDRPAAPTTPSTAATQEELIAAQLRAQLLSTLSGNILDAINNAKVGDSNTYSFGNQIVTYKKTSSETDITFTNTSTGAVNTVVIPSSSSSTSSTTAAAVSAARAGAAATSGNIALTGSLTGVNSGLSASGGAGGVGTQSAEQILSASSAAAKAAGTLPPL